MALGTYVLLDNQKHTPELDGLIAKDDFPLEIGGGSEVMFELRPKAGKDVTLDSDQLVDVKARLQEIGIDVKD